ncbi:hypothetical protein CK203_046394 [Vitis vinifera]|uniref:Uncharacterized protein n=1 Tax=Vitis vinifera TaxID=29760 RepID=A0A438I209_VITVI|nr:hypothetical protein CK203_046394 [Vitis vinifera]
MLNQDTRAEGRGRVARIQRRLLVVEVEKWIMQYQTCMNQGKRNNVEGMVEEEGLVDWINDCNLQSWSYNLKEIGSTSREESESPGCAEEFQGNGVRIAAQ